MKKIALKHQVLLFYFLSLALGCVAALFFFSKSRNLPSPFYYVCMFLFVFGAAFWLRARAVLFQTKIEKFLLAWAGVFVFFVPSICCFYFLMAAVSSALASMEGSVVELNPFSLLTFVGVLIISSPFIPAILFIITLLAGVTYWLSRLFSRRSVVSLAE